MGYEVPFNTRRLVFGEGHPFAGAEVVCKSVDMGIFLDLVRMQNDVTQVAQLLEGFSEQVLESWNLEINGEAVPANLEGMRRMPLDFVLALIQHWSESIGEVGGPLGGASSSGSDFLEGEMPMVPLSSSPAN